MKNIIKSSPLGIRIPDDIKKRFDDYCDSRGLKKNYLLSKMIEEKLAEFEEDEEDLKLAEQRIAENKISLNEFNKYIEKGI